jgi:hypothetical protein
MKGHPFPASGIGVWVSWKEPRKFECVTPLLWATGRNRLDAGQYSGQQWAYAGMTIIIQSFPGLIKAQASLLARNGGLECRLLRPELAMTDFNAAWAAFLAAIASDTHQFASTLAFVNQWYEFTPTAFRNGAVSNGVEQNQGSCRVLALALLQGLSSEQALRCFGEHYRDVLATPGADNHHNLRRLQAEGLGGIGFDHPPLRRKQV